MKRIQIRFVSLISENFFLAIRPYGRTLIPRNEFNSASLCNLAGRYDNPIPPRFLAPIDSLKIPPLVSLILPTPNQFQKRRCHYTARLCYSLPEVYKHVYKPLFSLYRGHSTLPYKIEALSHGLINYLDTKAKCRHL